MLVRRPENPRLIQSSHFCSSRSPVRSLRATLLSGGVRQRIETKTGTTRKEIQSATRMFRWNPSAVAPDPNPETIRSKKRQTISPTLRMWSRFSGVSGCQGFRRRRSHQDGQSSNATPTAAKRSKAIGATIAKYIFDTPLSEALALGVGPEPVRVLLEALAGEQAVALLRCEFVGVVFGQQVFDGVEIGEQRRVGRHR